MPPFRPVPLPLGGDIPSPPFPQTLAEIDNLTMQQNHEFAVYAGDDFGIVQGEDVESRRSKVLHFAIVLDEPTTQRETNELIVEFPLDENTKTMVNGTLTLRIHSLQGLPQIEQGEKQHIAGTGCTTLCVKIGDRTQETKSHGKGQESYMEQDLTFELEGVDGRESVIVEVLDDHQSVLCSGDVAITGDFIEGRKGESYALEGGGRTAHVKLTSKWQQHTEP